MNITKAMRENICQWVRQNAYKDEEEDLKQRKAEWGIRMRIAWNGGEEMTKLLDSLPPHFFAREGWLQEDMWRAHPDCYNIRFAMTKAPKFQYSKWHDEWREFSRDEIALKEKRLKLAEETDAVLRQCRTPKRAREVFPEFAEMLPVETAQGNLPAVQVQPVRDALCNAGVIECKEEEAA